MVIITRRAERTEKSKEDWLLFEKNILLIKCGSEKISDLRTALLSHASLPELIRVYMSNHFFFENKNIQNIDIITNTNEILGADLEGRVYGKNDKLIVHTHGVYVRSKSSPKSTENILSSDEFSDLLLGIVPGTSKTSKPIIVYREEELKKKKKKNLDFPCITVLRGDRYLKDPEYYCKDLNYTQLVFGFEKNGLLISRTLQEPSELMNFIKNQITYFRQTSPLIEPVILQGKNGANKLFDKYAYRVMPLILSDGEITKSTNDTKDAINFFYRLDAKSLNDNLYIAIMRNSF